MKSWHANLVVCDDFLFSLTGKITVLGVYTSDIGIPSDSHLTGQLVFLFLLTGDLTERPTQPLVLEVTLPGDAPRTMHQAMPLFGEAPGRTKWFTRTPFLLQNVTLRPGHIKARICHGKDEIVLGSPWITKTRIDTVTDSSTS